MPKITQQEFEDYLSRLRDNDVTLKELDLSGDYSEKNIINENNAKLLADALKYNTMLITLRLRYNTIGDIGAKALAEVLDRNSTLTTLGLWSNSIGETGAKALAGTLERNSTLTTLSLGYNSIGEGGAKALARVLENNNTLTTLDLGGNSIEEEGAKALAEVLERNNILTTLGLYNNSIRDTLTKQIEGFLKRNYQYGKDLLAAARKDDLKQVQNCIEQKKVSIHYKVDGYALLHAAAEKGHVALINYLLSLGAKTNEEGIDNNTPLHLAVQNNHKAVVDLLLKHGAKPDARNKDGQVALSEADRKRLGHVSYQPVRESSQASSSLTSSTTFSASKSLPAIPQANPQAKALYAYHATGGDDISFKAGDVLEVLHQDDIGWWRCRLNGKEGIVPSNYMSLLLTAGPAVPPKPSTSSYTPSPRIVSAPAKNPIPTAHMATHMPASPKTSPAAFYAEKDSKSKLPQIGEKGTIKLTLTIPSHELTMGKELGEGGFGVVYEGSWQYNTVAIKTLLACRLSDEALTEFKQEAGVMVSLQHENIVRFFGISLDQTPYRMVMEYMHIGCLYNYLHSSKPLEWMTRLQIAEDIAKGLAFLHNKSILHRDLKSLNVLLDKHMTAKLADFGLAKLKKETSTTTKTQKSVGTLRWMAPEIFGFRPKYSDKSDIYAYGIVAWEIAARKLPYHEVGDDIEIREGVKGGEREEIPSSCPEHFSQVISQCWQQEASIRPSAAKVIEMLKGGSVSTTSSSDYRDNSNSHSLSETTAASYRSNFSRGAGQTGSNNAYRPNTDNSLSAGYRPSFG